MDPITSLQNTRVKAAIKLRERRGRVKQKRIVIDGIREIRHAVEGGVTFVEVFTCEKLWASQSVEALIAQVESTGASRIEVTQDVWQKLTFGNRQDGVLAIATPPKYHFDDIHLHEKLFVAILDGIEKPGNAGAMIRSADGAGAAAVILTEPATDVFNPNAIRASIGTIFRLPVFAASREDAIKWLHGNAINTFLTRVGDGTLYTERDYQTQCAVVLGSEAHGLDAVWDASPPNSPNPFRTIQLPMLGAADSLNVSAAAAAVMYEVVRQRS